MTESINLWSKTAADNDDADAAINWLEGQLPGSMNGSARSMMAALAKWRDDIGGALTLAGGTTAYTLTTNSGLGALANGQMVSAKINAANTGASTLAVDSLAAKAIVTLQNGTEFALAANDLYAGAREIFQYDSSLASGSGAWVALFASLRRSAYNDAIGDINSTANGKGASLVGIEDSAGYITATTVEAALAEVRRSATGTRTTTTGGTAVTFTGEIPAWAREVSLNFSGLSLSGTDNLIVQLGTGSTYKTTGYTSNSQVFSNGPGIVNTTSTSGFVMLSGNAAYTFNGSMVFRHVGANNWQATGMGNEVATPLGFILSGFVALGGVLDSIRLTPTGSNTFDANGGVNWLAR